MAVALSLTAAPLLVAAANPPPESLLAGEGALSREDVTVLLETAQHRSVGLREAALARLAQRPEEAGEAVVEGLSSTRLALRLSCVELLERWGAPLQDADAWSPSSLARAKPRLLTWAQQSQGRSLTIRPPLDAEGVERAIEDLAVEDEGSAGGAMERLADMGPALLPRIRELAGSATSPALRRRLATLRYRVAMTRSLAMRSPELALLLAMTSGPARAQQVERQLRDTGTDSRGLLSELIQDGHPIVRETALRLLRREAGPAASDKLGELLSDPNPNVRAAVLKELTAAPDEDLAAALVAYVDRERDEDLLVHAVRALGAMRQPHAVQAMLELVRRDSWRVRAEVIQWLPALLARVASRLEPELLMRVTRELRRSLGDPDRFVRAKAIEAMRTVDDVEALPALLRIVREDPDLAPASLTTIASSSSMRSKAQADLRQFCSSEVTAIRAGAIRALARSTKLSVAEEVERLLGDPEREPRVAALEALVHVLSEAGPGSPPGRDPPQVPPTFWHRVALLLSHADDDERMAAARAAVVLGHEADALPVLLRAAEEAPGLLDRLDKELGRLSWEPRRELIEVLLGAPIQSSLLGTLLEKLFGDVPIEGRSTLWQLLDRPGTDLAVHREIARVLSRYPAGLGGAYSHDATPVMAKLCYDEARARLDPESAVRGSVALLVMFTMNRESAVAVAQEIMDDAAANPLLRSNALRLMLRSPSSPRSARLAFARLASRAPWASAPALAYLAAGAQAQGLMELEHPTGQLTQHRPPRSSYAFLPPPLPRSVGTELLRPHLSASGVTASYAANLLAMRGGDAGLPVLEARWVENREDAEARWLFLDAIVVLDRDELVRHIERIHGDVRDDEHERQQLSSRLGLMSSKLARDLRRRLRSRGRAR